MDKVTWKYNQSTNCVDEQPTMLEPMKPSFGDRLGDDISIINWQQWVKHLKSLRHIPVSGTVEWKDGEDVTDKFRISNAGTESKIGEGTYTYDMIPVAIPIKQEQPQQNWADLVFENMGQQPEYMENHALSHQEKKVSEIITAHVHEIDSLRVQIRQMAEQQGKELFVLPKLEKGDKIKLYGKETTVKGFEVSWNDGLMPPRYEIILLTTGRGDPFERSLDVIEIIKK